MLVHGEAAKMEFLKQKIHQEFGKAAIQADKQQTEYLLYRAFLCMLVHSTIITVHFCAC